MLTANVGQGQAVAGCGNASASPARSRVPIAPPAKIATISRRSDPRHRRPGPRVGAAAPAPGRDGRPARTAGAGSATAQAR